MTRSPDEQVNRIDRVQDSLATNQIAERKGDRFSRPQSPPSMDEKLAKQFASFLRNLPDQKLKESIKTQDQVKEWLIARKTNKNIADCFLAQFTVNNDPIEKWKNQGKLRCLKREMIWQFVKVYDSLWSLIEHCFSHIKNLLLECEIACPFPSAFNLFLEIVAINENTTYSRCLKPRAEEVVTRNEQFFKLARDKTWKGKLKEEDQKKLDQLSKNFDENLELFDFVWRVCIFQAQSSSLIATKVKEFRNEVGILFALITAIYADSRKGRIPEGKLTSSTWIEGILYQG